MRLLKDELNKIETIINKPKFGVRKAEKGSIIFKRKNL